MQAASEYHPNSLMRAIPASWTPGYPSLKQSIKTHPSRLENSLSLTLAAIQAGSVLEGGRNQVTLLYESAAGSRVVHDRVCGYTYSFNSVELVYLYPLAPLPAGNDPTDSEAPVYCNGTSGYDTILFPQVGMQPPAEGHPEVVRPSLAIGVLQSECHPSTASPSQLIPILQQV